MTTQTTRKVIDWTSIIWAVVAALVWLGEYDLTKLGLNEMFIETIKFCAAFLVIILQAFKPKKETEEG